MKSQKLGRGLDALLGEIEEAYENEGSNHDSIIEIPLKEIRPNPFQPRKSFTDESLHELAESIKDHGLLQPVVVTEDIDGYILIAGERRFRASKLAKFKNIRAIVLNTDEDKMRQFALIENIQREELNSIELAEAYDELIKLHNITHEALSEMIHKSRTHITNTLRLLSLSEKTKKALLEKKITAGHAKVLVGLDEKAQKLMVDSIIGQKLSVRDVEKMIKLNKESSSAKEDRIEQASHLVSYDFSKLKTKFHDLGLEYKINNNKVTLSFTSEKELENFLTHLG